MTGRRRQSQKVVTNLARDEDCDIRLPGICCGDSSTVVPCHYRLSGLSGLGFIPDALFVAHGCAPCHAYVDTHHDPETRAAFADGVFRTQYKLHRRGVIKIGKAA